MNAPARLTNPLAAASIVRVSDPTEASSDEIDVNQLAHEVRNLRKLVIAMLTMVLVGLTTLSPLHAFFSISRYGAIFDEMLAARSLPRTTQLTLSLGSSFPVPLILALSPISCMVWLWLERKRPATAVFPMLCLCVLLMIFLVWTHLTLATPMQQIISGQGAY